MFWHESWEDYSIQPVSFQGPRLVDLPLLVHSLISLSEREKPSDGPPRQGDENDRIIHDSRASSFSGP